MEITIRKIKEGDYEQAYNFQNEYLDAESMYDFKKRVQDGAVIYLVARDLDNLVGIIYGHPSDKFPDTYNLQGVAVDLDEKKGYARMGIGSRLIKEFEEQVKMKGVEKITLAAADDEGVEEFYMQNGYLPKEIIVNDDNYDELDRMKIDDYEHAKEMKEKMRREYLAKEAIIVFEKEV